jgi:hypothetical protein
LHRGHTPNDEPSSPAMDRRLLHFVLLLDTLDDDEVEEAKKLANDDGAVARFAFDFDDDDDDDDFPNMVLSLDWSLSRLGTAYLGRSTRDANGSIDSDAMVVHNTL